VNTRALTLMSPAALRMEPQYALFIVLLVTLGSFILYPVLIVFTNSFHGNAVVVSDATWSFDAWRTAFTEPGMRTAAWNTVKILVCTEIIAMPIAVFIAWLLARTDIPANSLLEFMFWVSFFLPALSVTFGWIVLLDPHAGVLNQLMKLLPFVETGPFNIYSFWGIIWSHVATQAVSVKVMLLTPSFRNLDSAFEEAARTSGADRWQTLVRIVIPVAFPAILTVLVLSTIRVMQTFEIEMVLGPPFNFFVFGTMIYRLIEQSPPQFGSAAALASIVFVIVAPLIVAHRWLITRKDYTSITGRIRTQPTRLGRWRTPLFVVVCLLVVTITLLPVSFVVMASLMKLFGFFSIPEPWTLAHWTRVINDGFFIRALDTTLRVAFGVAFTSIVLCTLVAYFSVRSRYRGRGLLDFLSWLPFAIPGILLGIGILYVVLGNPVLRLAYGTLPLLVLAMVVAHMTLGTQIVKSAMLQLGNQLEEAARTSGASWWTCLRKIVVPILAPTLALVGVANFISSSRDIATIALLAANHSKTLSLLQLDYLTDGQLETGAVISVVLIVLTTGIAFVARLFGLKMGIRG
jgi:iron(III) transport system permease protein